MIDFVKIPIKIIDDGRVPTYKTNGAVCADCYSNIDAVIKAESRKLIPLGFSMELPEGYEAVIRGRSGLSARKSVDVITGTIDWDYRGEVMANVVNNGNDDFVISKGDRICQIAIRESPIALFVIADDLSDTERSSNGFGSTGL